MRSTTVRAAALCMLSSRALLASGDGGFQSPLRISSPSPVSVAAGDFNRDGKLDLTAANGTSKVVVLLQDAADRSKFAQRSLTVGTGTFFVRAADFDGDGAADLVVADPGTTAYFLRCRGDGTFDPPAALTQSATARWLTVGDWNRDGHLDLATANHDALTVTIYTGRGNGQFDFVEKLENLLEPHAIEPFEYDGDGKVDLLLGVARDGNLLLRGAGDGTFALKPKISGLGCIGYIAIGDFDGDGLGDVATSCKTTTATISHNLGNGTFRQVAAAPSGLGIASTAVADLNGDDMADVAVAGTDSTTLFLYPGKGDGAFSPPLVLGSTGKTPSSLMAADLDGDGHPEVVSADTGSSTLTVFWGRRDGMFVESNHTISGFSTVKAMAIADLEGDGWPDLLFPSSTVAEVKVFLKPEGSSMAAASLTVATAYKYTSLEAVDLDGDGLPDIAGSNSTSGSALVALLDRRETPHDQVSLPSGALPGAVRVGRVDQDENLDLVVPCTGPSSISVFLGAGGGQFAPAASVPTIAGPKDLVLVDLDGDGPTDFGVISSTVVAIHFGKGGGEMEGPQVVAQNATRTYTSIAAGDLNGDGLMDLVVSDQSGSAVQVLLGKGNRGFLPPLTLKTGDGPVMVRLSDLDGDGRPDITTANGAGSSISVILDRGAAGSEVQVAYQLGFSPLGHRLGDLDNDGALDAVPWNGSQAVVLLGRAAPGSPGVFVRGDANGDGSVDISDALHILFVLYLGQFADCEDALDTNDDGKVDNLDAIRLLQYLFSAGPEIPPPFRTAGEDPTADLLGCSRG